MRMQRWMMLLVLGPAIAQASYGHGGSSESAPPGMRLEGIDDPTLGMTAFTVAVPAKWHFAGRMIQGTSCSSIAFPVFRSTSPDGLTVLERLPRMDWKWQDGPGAEPSRDANRDCLPLEQYLTAQEFLKKVAEILKVEYVGEDPIPQADLDKAEQAFARAKEANAAKYRANGMQPPEERQESGKAFVQYSNGSFKMKGLLSASIYCSAVSGHKGPGLYGPPRKSYGCTANVRYIHAPEAQLAAAVKMLEPAGAKMRDEYSQAWSARLQQQTQTAMANSRAQFQQSQAQLNASHQQFMQSQATNQRMHEQFLATMKRGTDMSMARANQGMQARSTATSNIVDYALDQQTVRDPNSGATNKVSSSYNYTWVDNTGKAGYQTNDGLANPNGVLQGTWTRQEVVNGDGTPK